MDIVVAGVAVIAFAAVIFVFAGTATRRRPESARVVSVADAEGWLTAGELATRLGVAEHDIAELVERDAVPFYVLRGGAISTPAHLRFKPSEIEAWTIG